MRVGTVQAQVAAFQAACQGDIQPPDTVKLSPEHMPVWTALIRSRAREEWSAVDLFHAANLARCLTDVERISAELAAEGDCIHNGRGTLVVNPRHAVLETLSRRAVALTKLLHLNANAIVENTTNLTHQREQEATARESASAMPPQNRMTDDLLARPSAYQ